MSEWLNLTAFLGTADSEVHIVHISRGGIFHRSLTRVRRKLIKNSKPYWKVVRIRPNNLRQSETPLTYQVSHMNLEVLMPRMPWLPNLQLLPLRKIEFNNLLSLLWCKSPRLISTNLLSGCWKWETNEPKSFQTSLYENSTQTSSPVGRWMNGLHDNPFLWAGYVMVNASGAEL